MVGVRIAFSGENQICDVYVVYSVIKRKKIPAMSCYYCGYTVITFLVRSLTSEHTWTPTLAFSTSSRLPVLSLCLFNFSYLFFLSCNWTDFDRTEKSNSSIVYRCRFFVAIVRQGNSVGELSAHRIQVSETDLSNHTHAKKKKTNTNTRTQREYQQQ